LNIGIVTHAYYPHFGGVTENVSGVARALRQLGHRVLIITAGAPRGVRATREADLVRIGGQRLVPWNGASVNFTYGFRLESRLRAIYRDAGLDLLHIHCPLSPMLPLAGLRAADGWPVVGMFHATARSNLGYQIFQPFLQREFARITIPVAVSEPARAFVGRYFPAAYQLVPNGVDLERFAPARPPLMSGPPTILALGRLDPRKGVEHLIDAMPRAPCTGPRAALDRGRRPAPLGPRTAGAGPRPGSDRVPGRGPTRAHARALCCGRLPVRSRHAQRELRDRAARGDGQRPPDRGLGSLGLSAGDRRG
jgi:phosphatidylinositol alpha-mannosyltransferase